MCALATLCLVAPITTVKLVIIFLYAGNVLDLVFNASMPPTTGLFTIHKTSLYSHFSFFSNIPLAFNSLLDMEYSTLRDSLESGLISKSEMHERGIRYLPK